MGFLADISTKIQSVFVDEQIDVDSLFAAHVPAQLSAFLPYRFYDEDSELYINDDGLGFVMEIVPLMGVTQQRLDVLKAALSMTVPDDVSVQVMQVNSPKIGTVLKRWGEARAHASEAHRSIMKNRLQHLGHGAHNSLARTSNFKPCYHRVFISVSMQVDDDPERELLLKEYKANLTASLKQCAGYAIALEPEALVRLLSDLLNPTLSIQPSGDSYREDVPLNKQLIREDTSYFIYRDRIETTAIREADVILGENPVTDNYIEDHMEMRALEVKEFPRHMAFGSMAAVLGDFFTDEIRFSSPTISVLNIYYPKAEQSKTMAETKAMRARQVAEGPAGRYMVSMRNRSDDFDRMQQAIVDGGRPVKVSMFCIVTARKGEGRSAERNARNVFQSAKFEMRRADQVHLPTLLAALPMCAGARVGMDLHVMKRSRTQISNMVVPSAPVFGEFMGTASPVMLLLGRMGQPWYWGPFASKGAGNYNGVVIGASGSGKSFWLSDLVVNHTGTNGHALIIDNGYSFQNLCQVLNGRHYTFSLKDQFCLNAFDMIDESLIGSDEDYLGERLETCRAIYAQMCLGDIPPTPEESGILSEAVSTVWAKYKRNGQTDYVRDFLKNYKTESKTANTKAMANAMLPYCSDGIYGRIFNGKNTLDLSNPLTVFETSPLEQKKELRSIIITALLALIDSKVTTDRSRSDLIVLDEAWMLLGSETLSVTLEGWARRLRKYGAGLMLGTQSIQDFAINSGAKATFENAEWTIILKSKNSAIQPMSDIDLFPDKYALKCAKDLKVAPGEYSECMILCENWYAVGRLSVDRFSAALFSTTAEDVAYIAKLKQEGHTLEQAIGIVSGRAELFVPTTESDIEFINRLRQDHKYSLEQAISVLMQRGAA